MIWQILSLLVDGILLEVGDYLSLFIRFGGDIPALEMAQFKEIVLFAIFIRLAVLYGFGVYQVSWENASWNDFVRIFKASILGAVLLVAASTFQNVRAYSRLVYVLSFIFSLGAICGWRLVLFLIRQTLWKSRRASRKTLVIGHDRGSGSLFRFISDEWRKGFQPFFQSGISVEMMDEVRQLHEKEKIRSVFIEAELLSPELLMKVLDYFKSDRIPCYIVPGRYEQLIRAGTAVQIGIQPFLHISLLNRNDSLFVLKTVVESCAAAVLMVILSPLFMALYILIRRQDHHHPIYKQTRIGQNGKKFNIYKFRTMKGSGDSTGEEDFVHDLRDRRITRIGRFLRRTSLDELPQLLNILKGDMSFVGPRPEIPQVVARYSHWQKQVLAVKPGVTGLAQVSGRKDLTISAKLSLDLYYIQNYSFWLDIKILFKTFFILFCREGNY